jgi:hypothetical protein
MTPPTAGEISASAMCIASVPFVQKHLFQTIHQDSAEEAPPEPTKKGQKYHLSDPFLAFMT